MYIFRMLVLLWLFMPMGLIAQAKFDDFEQQVRNISELEDHNEKEYRLAELSKTFANFIETSHGNAEFADTSYIHLTKSSDSKYSVYYYNTYSDGIIYRLDWYIVFGDINGRKVLHFSDKSFSHKDKRGIGEFRLYLSKMRVDDMDLYPLTFTFKTDMKIYREYRDIASICMFEQLVIRKTKEERLALNDSILKRMNILWNDKEYFEDDFEGIRRISTLISDDKNFKVCTWNVALPNSTHLYFGAIILRDRDGNIKVHPLKDGSAKMRSPEKAMLSPKKWYGAVYYDVVTVKDKNYGTYYALIGYKPNNEMTKKKVVDPFVIMNKTIPRFGYSIFQTDRVIDKRLIFEYSASANMMLRYEKHNQRFVLDHLSPPSSLYKGNYRFYGPDFSYDCYKLEKGKWVLYKDVDLRNPSHE